MVLSLADRPKFEKFKVDLSNMSEVDKAYIAGLFDGEGTVGIYENSVIIAGRDPSPAFHYEAQIANTDYRIIQWLLDRVGGRFSLKSKPKDKPNWRRGYVWRLTGLNAATFFEVIRPYTVIKSEQIDLALSFRANIKPNGVKRTPAELEEKRSVVTQLKILKRMNHAS